MQQSQASLFHRIIDFLSSWRSLPPYELVSYLFMFASVPMLAYGIQPYTMDIIWVIVFSVITLYAGFFAALIWNDITDSDIDELAHPDRPIPSGKISKKRFFAIALVFSAMVFVFSTLISLICFFVVGFAALFVAFHDKYLKKQVRFPAYSEIFTPIQWIVVAIFGYMAIWTSIPQSIEIFISVPYLGTISTSHSAVFQMILLVLFTYFAVNAHDLPEGIHDYKGDKEQGVRTYATSFGPKNAARISFMYFIISGVLAVLLYLYDVVSVLFLVLFFFNWLNIMRHSYRLLKADDASRNKFAEIAGRKGYDFFLLSYNLIFLDICVRVLMNQVL